MLLLIICSFAGERLSGVPDVVKVIARRRCLDCMIPCSMEPAELGIKKSKVPTMETDKSSRILYAPMSAFRPQRISDNNLQKHAPAHGCG